MYIVIVRCRTNAYRPIARKTRKHQPNRRCRKKKFENEKKKKKTLSGSNSHASPRNKKENWKSLHFPCVRCALVRLLALVLPYSGFIYQRLSLSWRTCACPLDFVLFSVRYVNDRNSEPFIIAFFCLPSLLSLSHLREPLFCFFHPPFGPVAKPKLINFYLRFYHRTMCRFCQQILFQIDFLWLFCTCARPFDFNSGGFIDCGGVSGVGVHFNQIEILILIESKKKRHLSNLNLLIFGSMMPPLDRCRVDGRPSSN